MHELFIEELTEVKGGLHGGPHYSTEACCEEAFTCCDFWFSEIIDKLKP